MKKYITTDGKTCRECNHYDRATDAFNYDKFESTVQHYPLTKEMPIGETFEGEEVWQFWDDIWISRLEMKPRCWTDCTDNNPEFAEDKGLKTRIAIAPIEKPLEGEEKADYSTGLTDGALHGWNLAIDECVKVLKQKVNKTETGVDHLLKMIVTELVTDINSLRK